MSKIMVVEDDASLREIYSIRITAEGYDVVSAGDGEEALAVAVREKPDLILSDVMMPKISGFDMLDILRSTPETHDIKVVMMTALSAEDQRQRGERLGADRYLVKSQVGIEDVVNTIHEVLGDREPVAEAAPTVEVAPAMETASVAPAVPVMPTTPEPMNPAPAVEPVAPIASPAAPAQSVPPMEPVAPNEPIAPVEPTVTEPAQPVESISYGEQPAGPAQ